MNQQLKVKIPFWYKPFIIFMPKFWECLPEEKEGKWTAAVRVSGVYATFIGAETVEYKKVYTSIQEAYLKARWEAMWTDFFDCTSRQILWVIKNKSK